MPLIQRPDLAGRILQLFRKGNEDLNSLGMIREMLFASASQNDSGYFAK